MREWRALRLRLVATHGPAATFGPIARARHDRYINGRYINGGRVVEIVERETQPLELRRVVEQAEGGGGELGGVRGM